MPRALPGSYCADMRKVLLATALSVGTLNSAAAFAGDAAASQSSMKRQMIICMNKSMSASRTLSYNDALRDCKEIVIAHTHEAGNKRALTASTADAPRLKTP